MSQNNHKCEMCGSSSDFRFDGQHMICKCGTVLIRKIKSAAEIEKEKKILRDREIEAAKDLERYEKFLETLTGHYKKMNGFKDSFNKTTYSKGN